MSIKQSTASGQAQRVYAVESAIHDLLNQASDTGIRDHRVFGTDYVLPQERRFGSLESVHSYVDQLTGLRSFYAEFGSIATPQVKPSSKNAQGEWNHPSATGDTIYMAPHGGGISTHLREMRVLHELAHSIDVQVSQREGTKSHGHSAEWVDIFLRLIVVAMDDEMFATMFKYMLMDNGVKL